MLGHESVGRVLEAPVDSDLSEGDLVVGIVRRPDPVPCANCAVGEWDMCRNGRYTEHGIKGLHGFARERYRAEPDALVAVDGALGELGVLLEPTSVVAKAWEHVQRIGSRAHFEPATALVTGAGPVGLLAAMIGVQSGYDVHVLDQVTDGAKPQLVHDLGATYHSEPVEDLDLRPDVVVECTGVGPVVAGVLTCTGPNGIICLTGVSSPGRTMPLDLGALNREWVLENDVVFGSVNANRRHYELAGEALAQADRSWLDRLVTRAVPLDGLPRRARQARRRHQEPHHVRRAGLMATRIEDYGVIGDLHTAALIGKDGSVDWLCLPRFDSPACFAALLDTPEAGRWQIAPVGAVECTRRQYRDDSLVLETEWDTPDGTVRVIDFMPPRDESPTSSGSSKG
ncbi:MAG: trehalase-like domain-containing protein [Nocardioidaceae bacterium]